MAKTLALPKDQLVKQALTQMQNTLADNTWTDRQKLALTCRILFENGHDSGLAGQITARGPQPGTYYTQQLGLASMKSAPATCCWSTKTWRSSKATACPTRPTASTAGCTAPGRT